MGSYKKMVGIGALVMITFVAALLVISVAGYKVPLLPYDSDVSHLFPFSDYIGEDLTDQKGGDDQNSFPISILRNF